MSETAEDKLKQEFRRIVKKNYEEKFVNQKYKNSQLFHTFRDVVIDSMVDAYNLALKENKN